MTEQGRKLRRVCLCDAGNLLRSGLTDVKAATGYGSIKTSVNINVEANVRDGSNACHTYSREVLEAFRAGIPPTCPSLINVDMQHEVGPAPQTS